MVKARSSNRDKAFNLWQESGGKISNREIANQLEISEKTISGWKYILSAFCNMISVSMYNLFLTVYNKIVASGRYAGLSLLH